MSHVVDSLSLPLGTHGAEAEGVKGTAAISGLRSTHHASASDHPEFPRSSGLDLLLCERAYHRRGSSALGLSLASASCRSVSERG